MITSLTIEGYRCFEHFEMNGLGRVNLLVGKNNSGKTSVLEAIFLLMSQGNPLLMWQLLYRRGEFQTVASGSPVTTKPEADISHLFRGHRIRIGSQIRVSANHGSTPTHLTLTVANVAANGANPLSFSVSQATLQIEGHPSPSVPAIPLNFGLDVARNSLPLGSEPTSMPLLITSDLATIRSLVALWDGIVLTPAEESVNKALRLIDPDLDRIAVQTGAKLYLDAPTRGGFVVRLRGSDHPIPIGSMGDGMWRMLAIAISLTQARGNVLLVDEIDTGLHYSVMTELWQWILNVAKEFDVQVFATTHSFDCVESLARASARPDDVTVQRIEAGMQKSIPYDEEVLRAAAEYHIEVR